MKKRYKHPPRVTPGREERYMGVAWLWAGMSKDPSTQVGAVIVSSDNRPLGTGYNGPPKQMIDSEIDWVRPDKYPYIFHAEKNAIRHCLRETKGSTMYVTGRPCPPCMLDIVAAGIYRVIYCLYTPDESSMLAREDEWETTLDIAKKGNVQLEKFKGNLNWMRDWMDMLYEKGIF